MVPRSGDEHNPGWCDACHVDKGAGSWFTFYMALNQYEHKARLRKVHALADAIEAWFPGADGDVLADATTTLTDATWEALEREAGTRPQKTQDLPASKRTRLMVANQLRYRARARTRAVMA